MTLEPSAGTGNLLAALFESGHSVNELVAIERHNSLCQTIRQRFSGQQDINPLQRCFLEYAGDAFEGIEYPRIIMNPPFKKVRRHVAAALSLLGGGGLDRPTVLMALVPITYRHDAAKTLETLPRDTFAACAVNTQIVRFTL